MSAPDKLNPPVQRVQDFHSDHGKAQLLKSTLSRMAVLSGACLLALAPFSYWGIPSGHDFEFHVFSWMEVLSQWKAGIFSPVWAAGSYWGFGEARFLFYPPASWTLGAALGALLPWSLVPAAYCWIVLTLAAAAMYRLAREWLNPADSMFAAAFYALNPYFIVIVYWRSAFAEMLGGVLVPLLFLAILRLHRPGALPVLGLGLTLAAGWLTNIPAAVMLHYSAAGLVTFFAAKTFPQPSHAFRFMARAALGFLLGAGLAAFYLVPATYEQHWINISQVMSPGVRPQDNFLFTTLADEDHNRFNLLISIVAIAETCLLALAGFFARRWREEESTLIHATSPAVAADSRTIRLQWPLLLWGTSCAFLMLSVSKALWLLLPKLRYVQLPFRWLLCLNAALALLVTMAAKRSNTRILSFIFLAAVLLVAGIRIQPPWWDSAADLRDLNSEVTDGSGYEGTDEYVPAGVDVTDLDKNMPRIVDQGGKRVESRILLWKPMEKRFDIDSANNDDVTIRLFNYPAWKVIDNGIPVTTESTDDTGLMIIPISVGRNQIDIYFHRTIDRVVGTAISLSSLVLLVIVWVAAALGRRLHNTLPSPDLKYPVS